MLESGAVADPDKPDDDDDDDWPEGLVAIGGSLAPDALIEAYRVGVFPWGSDPELTWWCPDPRAVFDLKTWQAPRSLRKTMRHSGWRLALDEDFEGVMRRCAAPTKGRPTTWITEDFLASYCELFRRGLAHSVAVFDGNDMVGGLYGVSIGGFFGGESMFHTQTDASKAALAYLVERLRVGGFTLLDAQVPNPHLMRMGATLMPRTDYLRALAAALDRPTQFRL